MVFFVENTENGIKGIFGGFAAVQNLFTEYTYRQIESNFNNAIKPAEIAGFKSGNFTYDKFKVYWQSETYRVKNKKSRVK